MDSTQERAAAEMRRLLDQIANSASTLKLKIEEVQCAAIDARLALTACERVPAKDWMMRTRRQLLVGLDGALADIEALIAAVRKDANSSPRLQ